MRVPRIYEPQPLSAGAVLTLGEDGANHVGRVLRMQTGQELMLFNGQGGQYPATILEVGKKQVQVQLAELDPSEVESPLHIHLGQVISRGDKMEFTIQKSVELGVNTITPLFSERCGVKLSGERLDKKLEQWQKIAISACEQCGRSRLPAIHAPLTLGEWLEQTAAELKLVLHPVAEPLTGHARPASLAFLIGPEGGLSDAEVAQAQRAGYQAARLGPRVLRTETAPVVALSVAQQLWGDF